MIQQRAKPMLYLRRYEGEDIYVFDNRSETLIKLVELDPETGTAWLYVSGEDRQRVFEVGEVQDFLQGDGQLRLAGIQEFSNGKSYANIGIHAPQEMLIRRREMLAGTSRKDRAAMVR